MTNKEVPAGIYIHIPFCLKKCDYCDFYSVSLKSPDTLERYVSTLIQEVGIKASYFHGRDLESIYIGGGTPSLLKANQIERIIDSVQRNYVIIRNAEITMELNPATVQLQGLRDYKQVGINRLSVGVQSFNDHDLKTLGRIHSANDASSVVNNIIKSGIDNFNIDLIYGVPDQSIQVWQENLNRALSYNPQHISTYLLQLEARTPMARKIAVGQMQLLEEDLEADIYYHTIDCLVSQGYEHYEISNFARPDNKCRHNIVYWKAQDYLGIGAGAVSFVNGQRFINKPLMEQYMRNIETALPVPQEILEDLDEKQLALDAIIVGLRMTCGIDRTNFLTRFGIDIVEEYHDIINECVLLDLLLVTQDRVMLTRKGYFLSNQVFYRFIT